MRTLLFFLDILPFKFMSDFRLAALNAWCERDRGYIWGLNLQPSYTVNGAAIHWEEDDLGSASAWVGWASLECYWDASIHSSSMHRNLEECLKQSCTSGGFLSGDDVQSDECCETVEQMSEIKEKWRWNENGKHWVCIIQMSRERAAHVEPV